MSYFAKILNIDIKAYDGFISENQKGDGMKSNKIVACLLSAVMLCHVTTDLAAALPRQNIGLRSVNAVSRDYVTLGGLTFKQTQVLEESGNNTYTLTLSLQSELGNSDQNEDSQFSKDGYFTAGQSGLYLIELWGGSGAAGQDTSYSGGGRGGNGGHVYGEIYLNAGETLYYTLGGNGIQTVNTDSGGGANGSGGNHGEIGSYAVGGGGGYSAVFLFGSGEFEEKYIDSNGNVHTEITESDRITKYIMIAGGGGGGGAGNGFSIGSNATGLADGGAGGSVGGNFGVISEAGYDVPGTFFAGENGKSSGTSTAYVGIGATNVPGTVSDTITTLFDVEVPNDWKGTYNVNTLGGAGGAGNLRGGSGGAGFCGGSGGIMTGLLIPTNVGGGGGGSSFLATNVNYLELSDKAKSLLLNDNPSAMGGAVNITFLGEQRPEEYSFSFSGIISKYFDVEDIITSSGSAALKDDVFTVNNASFIMSGDYKTGSLTVSLLLKAKDGFAGGNNVPIVEGNVIQCTLGTDSAPIELNEKCRSVNIPLNFTVISHSHVTNIIGQTFSASQLYSDNYYAVRNSLDDYWQYDFIDSIGAYTVTDANGSVLQAQDTITATDTCSYTVAFTVVPKSGAVSEVGEPVSVQIFSKPATITVFSANSGALNGNRLSYVKSLSYDEQTDEYDLSLQITSGTDNSFSNVSPIRAAYSTESKNWTAAVPASGYYMFQIWGGNGGQGYGRNGGAGGFGGYVHGVAYLNAEEIIAVSIGANGADSSSSKGGGGGGEYTSVKVGNEIILIAGGGGGGGGYGGFIGLFYPGKAGESVSNTHIEFSGELSDYSGGVGGTGTWIAAGEAGAAGNNFRHNNVLTDVSNLSPQAQSVFGAASQSDYSNNDIGGAFYVTPIQLDDTHDSVLEDVNEALSDYSVDVDISDYFTITGVTVKNSSDETNCTYTENISGQHVSVSGINPFITAEETVHSDGSVDVHAGVDFTVCVHLKVREGFLGGNDVPVLSYENAANSTGMKISQKEQTVSVNRQGANNPNDPNKSDFANISIRYDIDISRLAVNEVNYVRGDAGIPHSALYSYQEGAEYTWEDDYVIIINPLSVNAVYAPAVTELIPIEVGISPIVTVPVKASVGTVAQEEIQYKNAVINVLYQVMFNLSNLKVADTPDDELGRYFAEPGQGYSSTIMADKGTILPAQIFVEIGGRTLSPNEYAYDPKTGDFLIPADQVTDNITITAHSDVNEVYTIHYVYETKPGSAEFSQVDYQYEANTQIYNKFSEEYIPAEYNGYVFRWDWGADDGITVMPDRDIWVFGSYEAVMYTLTIEYTDENGSKLFEDYQSMLAYDSEYTVESPVKTGYLADQPVVSGKMSDNIVIRVVYTPTYNQLNIIYIFKDSTTVHSVYQQSYGTDEQYCVESPSVAGYTPDQTTVEGIMTSDGVTVYVYYVPDSYTVYFDAQGGNCTVTEKTVVFNNIYGYNGTEYSALPTPIKVGYEFAGWYLGDMEITETTPVTQFDSHTLTAKWIGMEYQIAIKYVYETGLPAAESADIKVAYGEQYYVQSPPIFGYTPDQPAVTGTMMAQNTAITVTYFKNSYLLTIHYLYADGREAHQTYAEEIPRGSAYSVESPEVAGHSPDNYIVQGDGIFEDTEVQVTYAPNSYTLTIHYQTEDGVRIFDDYKGSYVYASTYSVISPAYGAYVPSIETVSGVMGAADQEITVTYYPGEVPEIISVDIEWGEFVFHAEYDGWNPKTHSYDDVHFTPRTSGANYVKLINRSTVSVSATVNAAIDSVYTPYIDSFFTEGDMSGDPAVSDLSFILGTDTANNRREAWLWLNESSEGAMAASGLNGEMTIGTCTITISKVEE